MAQFQQMFAIGNTPLQLTFEPMQRDEEQIIKVSGYGQVYHMGQNESGGWEFMSGVPEELAVVEDEISCFLEDTLEAPDDH